jgi:hypothetical protein
MKSIKYIGVLIATTVAMAAVGVASASAALPEFKVTSFPVTFKSHNVENKQTKSVEPVLASYISLTSSEENIVCKASTDEGKIETAKKVGAVKVTYTGCKEVSTPADTCTSSGKATGEIVTKTLTGEIGYVEGKVTKEVGLELKPEAQPFSEFTCTGKAEKVTVKGCTIGEATPINTKSTTGDLGFEESSATSHKQKWTKLEGKSACELEVEAGFFKLGKGPSWLEATDLEEFSASLELTA